MLAVKDNQPTQHVEMSDYFLRQIEEDNADGKRRRQREVEAGWRRTQTRETFVPVVPTGMSTGRVGGLGVAFETRLSREVAFKVPRAECFNRHDTRRALRASVFSTPRACRSP